MAGEVIFARLSQLEAFGMKVVTDFTALTARVRSLERAGGQPNIIEKILVNGIQLAVDGNKAVSFSVPTKASQLENDAGFQNGTQVDEKLSTKADSGHDHDGRYFTKEQVNSAIAGKADTSHTHDDRYYTESEVDDKFSDVAAPAWDSISGKPTAFTPTDHTHDDRYYTEAEVDEKLTGVAASGHNHDDRYYTESEMDAKLNGKANASHTHNYAGSSSAGGAANSANKLNTNAGSATQGVYFKDGVPVAMTYTLGKSVPADAKFTDTNTWRGVQDNLTSTATDQSLSANQGKVLKGLVDGKAASSHTHDDRYYTESEMNTKLNGKANASHTHDDRYYTESEMNTKLNGKANSSHTHNYAGSSSAGGTANSVNGLTFAAQTTDPGAGSSLATNKVLIVYA